MEKPEPEYFTSDFKKMINVVFWNSLGLFFITFLTPIIAKSLMNATDTQVGLVVSVQIFGYLISSTIAGPLTDRISKKKLVMFGSFGRAFGYLIFYIAINSGNLWMLMTGTFSIGFGVGSFWIPLDALMAEKSHKEVRSNAYGMRSSRMGLGSAVGATIGFAVYATLIKMDVSPLLIYFPILLYALANIYAGLLFYFTVDESLKITYNFESEIDPVTFGDAEIESNSTPINRDLLVGGIIILAVLFLSTVNGSLARPFMQNYLLAHVNNNPQMVSMAYLPPALISMLLAPYLGKLADKMYPAIAITISSIFGAIFTYLIINSSNLLVVSILWTFDSAVVHLAGLSIVNIVSRASVKNRGKMFASLSIFENIGGIIGPILGGVSSDTISDKAPFLISIIVEIALIPLYWLALKFFIPNLEEKKATEVLSLQKSVSDTDS